MSSREMLIQAVITILTISLLYILHSFPHKTLSKLRLKSKSSAQANKHFVTGAQLLSRARATRNKNTSNSLASDAVSQADQAILLDKKDAASHILKALALDLLGRKAAALRSLDTALSQRSLADTERGDALLKRAELQFAVNKRRRVDAAIDDVTKAVTLGAGSAKAYCLLGECYKVKGMREKAREAFEEAVRVEPGSALARQKLEQLLVEQYEKVREVFEDAMQVEPGSVPAKQVMNKINSPCAYCNNGH